MQTELTIDQKRHIDTLMQYVEKTRQVDQPCLSTQIQIGQENPPAIDVFVTFGNPTLDKELIHQFGEELNVLVQKYYKFLAEKENDGLPN